MAWKIVLVIYLAGYVHSEKGAISEQRVVIHQLKSEKSDKPLQDGSKKTEYREEYAWSYPSYEFSYKVNDPETHDIKGQHEKRHGDEVKGLYWLIDPNGHKRTVNYQADDNNGFNAQVHYTDKQQSTDYKSVNSEEINDAEEKPKEVNENNAQNEENSNSDKEQGIINNRNNVNQEAKLIESNLNEQNNIESQDAIGAAELETDNQNENNDENQNNENSVMNVIENNNNECCSENLQTENMEQVQEENKENIMEYNNRRRSRAHKNTNENSGRLDKMKSGENGRNQRNQNNNKFRHRENMEQNRKSAAHSKRGANNRKYATRVSRGGKNKENIDVDSKNYNDEKKEQSNNYERRFVALNAKENLADANKNIDENKSNRFEHRIRIHHPKPIIKT